MTTAPSGNAHLPMQPVAQRVLLDVTDLVEFLQRQESVSGVQRVVAETVPLLIGFPNHSPILLDRHRGEFVELTASESEALIDQGARAQSTQTDRAHFSRNSTKMEEITALLLTS